MGLLRDILTEQKFFETVEEVDTFLSDKEVSSDALVQSLIFDSEVFKTSAEAMEWAATHGFRSEVEELDGTTFAAQFDVNEFESDTLKIIEIRRGVKAQVGELKQAQDVHPMFLSLRNKDGITFSETLPHVIELAKVVKGTHATFGEVEITKDMLMSFRDNFDNKVLGVDVSVDIQHSGGEAVGWLKSVYLSQDGNTLLGEVSWTPKGAQSLESKAFRYYSPEFSLNFSHPLTGEQHGPTMLGGALVNRPFLKMDAIVSLNNPNEGDETVDTIKLSDHLEKVSALEKQLNELTLSESAAQGEIKGMKEENEKLSSQVIELQEAEAKRDKDQVHRKLFDEGKICKAQLDALCEGKSMLEVLSLSEKMNSEPKGKDGGSKEEIKLSEVEAKICADLELTAEEYQKYNQEGGN